MKIPNSPPNRLTLIGYNRSQMPPISYFTLLDVGLIVNLSLVALILLVVTSSAVSVFSTNCCDLTHHFLSSHKT